MNKAKSCRIPKQRVWEAYKKVKANQGAAGVDEESIADFEKELKGNLYKIWNRMSSGSYFPPPVLTVAIPKSGGGERKLGIPTVGDRIAQMVVKMEIEPGLETVFHPDSYGYRPGKSAHEAVGRARQRCWRYDWVLDMDIKAFFDNIDHGLLMKAVRKHVRQKWVQLYLKRWLTAPAQTREGRLEDRSKGTPQGGVVSPVLANLYLHYGFDEWMRRNHRSLPFERYADDAIVHCKTQKQAVYMQNAIGNRLAECGLELNRRKTKVVYCKDDDRRNRSEHEKFAFLGYTFRPRRSKNRWGKYFINFSPADSDEASKEMRAQLRSWKLHLRSDKSLEDISAMFNPVIRGWINYYGRYYPSALYPTLQQVNRTLSRWACRKYKKLRGHRRRSENPLKTRYRLRRTVD